MLSPEERAAYRQIAASLPGIDVNAYTATGRDPCEPLIGLGCADSRVAIMGRDPGRSEVKHGLPFAGAGGQRLRRVLYQHQYGQPMPDVAAGMALSGAYFWLNTVPYKPIGNRAWPASVRSRFQPLTARLLARHWRGSAVITLGREAFFWFGIGQDKSTRDRLRAFWTHERTFTETLQIDAAGSDEPRTLTLYPLPHPSPLNRLWYTRFPDLLAARLRQIDRDAHTLPHSPAPPRG